MASQLNVKTVASFGIVIPFYCTEEPFQWLVLNNYISRLTFLLHNMKIFYFFILYGNSQVASSLFLFSQVQSYFPGSGGGGSVIHTGRERRSSSGEQKHVPHAHFICVKSACFLLKPCTCPHPGTSQVLFTQHRTLFPPSHPQAAVHHSSFTVSSESIPIMMTSPLIIQTESCVLFSAREKVCLVTQLCPTL